MTDDDLHDLLVYGFGVVTGICVAVQAQNNRTVHVIDHSDTAVDREDMR